VTDRSEIRRALRDLYAARVGGDLDRLCRAFAEEATFRIAGIGRYGSPIVLTARGVHDIRQWLSLLIKTFSINDHVILSMIVENDKASVHWQAKIYSRVTGLTVPTEVVDLVEMDGGRVVSYAEFLAPSR
jgi:ketosteroid isomerase-like protein